MKRTFEALMNLANRLKLISALLALFLSGALISMTLSVWYYDRVISKVHGSYGGRIASFNAEIRRLNKQVDHEQNITRNQLKELGGVLMIQAKELDKISDDVARLLHLAEDAAKTAARAANTAKTAATTAEGAAANAAKSTIRVTEVPAEPDPVRRKSPWGNRIEP